jgi:hypothetical protein
MTEYVQWGSVPEDSNGGDNNLYLKMKTGGTYKIRPVLDPVKFFKYFHKHEGKLRTAICDKPDVCPVRDRHPELKKPSMRYAAYVIDRNDGNKIKILEAPQSVFRPIGSTFESTGKNPGSKNGGSDFQVKVTGVGLNTKYDVAWAGSTPMTPEEVEALKVALDGDMKKLQKLYKVDTPEQIEAKLFDSVDESGSGDSGFGDAPAAAAPAVVESAAPAPTPATTEAAPAEPATGGDDWDNNF